MKPAGGDTTIEVQFEDGPGILVASATGSYSLEAMLPMLERVAAEARTRGARRVLIDVSRVGGEVPDLDRYEMGKYAAGTFAHIERLGVLRAPDLRYTGFAFDVAQTRGLDARPFVARAQAERWLASD